MNKANACSCLFNLLVINSRSTPSKPGQQIRSIIDSFHDYFLISQPNPMMSPLIGIVLERRFQ